MSITKQTIRQRDFSAGEIDPDGERRDDTEIFKYGVRYARNMQSLRTGGLENRYGRDFLYVDDGVRDDFRLIPNIVHSVTFAHLRATIRNAVGVVIATLAAPWTSGMVDSLVWTSNDNMVIVTGPSPMRPQVIEVNRDTFGWTIRDYDFRVGLSGIRNIPFYRFAKQGITMQPSGLTGNITVTFSAPVLNAQHVGAVFRYAGKQLQITGVSSSTLGSASCLEALNPTVKYSLLYPDEITFSIGQIVQTSASGVEGEVIGVDVAGRSVTVVVLNRWRKRSSAEDRVVGPGSDADTDQPPVFVSPGATTQWDEQFIGNYRGWPQSVAKDSQRIIFSNFPQLKSAIVWSTVADPFDLKVNADATGAIFELIDADCQVYHIVGGYDEFAITDIGVFYIPISSDNPLKPGSVEFRRLYSGEVANVKPIEVTEGVLFVDQSRTGIYAITATGQVARPYAASEISQFHRHLFDEVRSIASNSGTPKAATRQVYAVNGDGSVVIGQFNSDRNYVGWLKWDGQGSVHSVSARFGDVVFSSSYSTAAGTISVAERINPAREFDCSLVYSGPSSSLVLAGVDVQVMADGFYYGTMRISGDGSLPLAGSFNQIVIGFEYDWSLIPNLADVEGGEALGQRLRRRKISKAVIKVRDTQEFQCGNKVLGGYRGGEDTALPIPARSAVYQYRQQGRDYDPQYELRKTLPGRFKLLELTTEITV
nr:MAG TPA: stabilization protein [Caudoviricetes sp.]